MCVTVNPGWASALTPSSQMMAFAFALGQPEDEWGRTWWKDPGSRVLGLDPASQPNCPYLSGAILALGAMRPSATCLLADI